MAIDKAVDSAVLDNYFSGIAAAIREKNGETAQYTPAQMAEAISNISAGAAGVVSGVIEAGVNVIETGLSRIAKLRVVGDEIYPKSAGLSSIVVLSYDAEPEDGYYVKYASVLTGSPQWSRQLNTSSITVDGGTFTWNITSSSASNKFNQRFYWFAEGEK